MDTITRPRSASAALKTWQGAPANIAMAQAALHHRARCNGLAVQGKYSEQAKREGPGREKHQP